MAQVPQTAFCAVRLARIAHGAAVQHDAMAEVGDLLPCSLKETSQAGLAQTETGKKYMPES